MNEKPLTLGRIVGYTATALVSIVLIVMLLVGGAFGCAAYNRYQARADNKNHRKIVRLNALNQVSVSSIEIRNQAQRIKVARQQAAIRYQTAVGVREAQDEIAKTLTPLYVQFEMVDALKTIAASGQNNTVVYVPSGANGIPLVSTLPTGKVGRP